MSEPVKVKAVRGFYLDAATHVEPGKSVEVDAHLARQLIQDGKAVPATQKPERATRPPDETR